MIARHAVRSANRQALIAAAQHLAAASSTEDTNLAMAALREALVPYADRERTMRPPKAKPEPEVAQVDGPRFVDPRAGGRGEIRVISFGDMTGFELSIIRSWAG